MHDPFPDGQGRYPYLLFVVGAQTFVRDYESLPDSMPPEDIAALFIELLEADADLGTLNAFCQLADRQWHTYTPLDETIHRRVDAWWITHWESNSLVFARAVCSVVGHLGLAESWAKINSDNHASPDVAAEFVAFIAEIERGDPLDPWSGMPKP